MNLSLYIPSYAWWLVLVTSVLYGVAFWLPVWRLGVWPASKWGRFLFPLLTITLAVGLYFLEHFNRLTFGPHPFSLGHLAAELAPLAILVVLWALVAKSWLGWAKSLALVAAADAFILLFWPGPLVNHLYQLTAVMALIWGVLGLTIALKKRQAVWLGPLVLLLGGGIGTYCEIGMMFL